MIARFFGIPEGGISRWLIEPIRQNKSVYMKVAIAAFMVNLFALATPLFTMTVYDRVVPNNATESLIALSIGLALVIILDFVLRTLRAYFVDVAGADIDRAVGRNVFDHMLNIRMDLKKGSTGALAGLMRELETLRDFFASATVSAIVDVPFILMSLLVIFLIGGPVVIVPALLVPIVILIGYLTQPALDRLSKQSMQEGLLKQSVLVETIGGLEMVKASNAGPILTKRWLEAIRQHSDFSLRQRLVSAISVNSATSAQMIAYAGVIVIGVGLIAEQRLTMGGLIACSILAGRAVAPLGQIASLLARISMTKTAYRQIDAIMETPKEGPQSEPLHLADIKGKIEFRNVEFRYPGAAETALERINFTINPGEHVALLGRVGSGKSTIAKLILGLFPPTDGVIMLDGTDIRQLKPEHYRKSIGSIMQDTSLLSGTVRENISLGREGVDDAELVRAAEISGTHRFMGQIVNGYDLHLADRGEGLSGGQRQTIGIARALAGKPAIFIFDEPTSAMDDQTEAALIQALKAECEGRTLILITHRPSVLKLVDRIILLHNKTVVADGPRDKVLAKIRGDAQRSRAKPAAAKAEKLDKPDTATATNQGEADDR
ncbi:type I secretion system permease/ATPase [Sphingomicrobium clamense]|uniref:Type I secretion system permease/ATPase n=1 Tax=Sphingomicrobium clamense TaxID=2851013 RepID=A0ABS6V3S0_9SPHN|nr:type I secretion system permease/ATPase [Sphingomicrobium sp. B8]MBW0144146.1 type I secretion system permease/ATPase [Sphingomicrobium sp. B8]